MSLDGLSSAYQDSSLLGLEELMFEAQKDVIGLEKTVETLAVDLKRIGLSIDRKNSLRDRVTELRGTLDIIALFVKEFITTSKLLEQQEYDVEAHELGHQIFRLQAEALCFYLTSLKTEADLLAL